MADTIKASWITDHAFEPRDNPMRFNLAFKRDGAHWVRPVKLSPNPYLCQHCRLAEAAHRETTLRPQVCATCHGEGRIDLNAGWHGPPGVERHHWHPCPDCDGHRETTIKR